MSNKTAPRFRVCKKEMRVWLQCSECEVDIREIKKLETIRTTRAYHCEDCDDGTIVLNTAGKKIIE